MTPDQAARSQVDSPRHFVYKLHKEQFMTDDWPLSIYWCWPVISVVGNIGDGDGRAASRWQMRSPRSRCGPQVIIDSYTGQWSHTGSTVTRHVMDTWDGHVGWTRHYNTLINSICWLASLMAAVAGVWSPGHWPPLHNWRHHHHALLSPLQVCSSP